MNRITLKLIKYFMSIILFIVTICFFASSIFLSKYYMNMQYSSLKASAQQIYNSLLNNEDISEVEVSAVLIKDSSIESLTRGKMGMMPFIHSLEDSSFETKGKIQNPMGSEFLYFRLDTELGSIVVFKSNKYSSEYLKMIYGILFLIFITALALSVPLISYIGRKFTDPILKLQRVASSISRGDFDIRSSINTGDEIEDLSSSLIHMADELRKKYDMQRDFIANVSHDFKTPLSVIRSYSEAIKDGLVGEENIEKYSGDIIQEVDRLNTMVMDLLQLSKLQDGAYDLNKDFICLPEFINECASLFNSVAFAKNVTIRQNINSVEIYADRHYLKRVIYNFLDNAVKFSSENTVIDVYTTFEKDFIKICIRDYGVGIEEHYLEDIWNKYHKSSQSGGMGLGLPICREILKKHGFNSGVTSTTEHGTEFYFLVPISDVNMIVQNDQEH